MGDLGPRGRAGPTKSWLASGYICPAGSTATMRLEDCTTQRSRLEVLFEGPWGSVCSRGFTDLAAQQSCSMLGFEHGGGWNANKGGGGSIIWLSDVVCTGREGDIGDCKHAVSPGGRARCCAMICVARFARCE